MPKILSREIEKVTLYLLILSLPLYILRYRIGGSLPTTAVEIAFFIFLVTNIVTLTLRKEWKKLLTDLLSSSFILPAILFGTAGFISVYVSPDLYKSLGLFRAFILEPLVVFGLLHREVYRQDPGTLRTFFVSGLLVGLYGLYQLLTGTNDIAPLEAAQGRITSFFNHPNYLSLYLGPIILIALYLCKERGKRFFYLASLLFMTLIFYTTHSLGGYIALFGSYVFIALMYMYQRFGSSLKRYIPKILLLVFSVVLAIMGYLFLNISDYTPKNSLVWPRPDPSTFTIRLCVWEGSKNLLFSSPLLGAGLGGFYLKYPDYRTCDTEHFVYPHNIVLNFWLEMGVLGILSFLWIIFLVYKKVLENPSKEAILLGSIVLFWLIAGLVDVPYFKNDLSIFFWIVIALLSLQERVRLDQSRQ